MQTLDQRLAVALAITAFVAAAMVVSAGVLAHSVKTLNFNTTPLQSR